MRKLTMFITAVCVLFVIKLKWESHNKFERREDKPGGYTPLKWPAPVWRCVALSSLF